MKRRVVKKGKSRRVKKSVRRSRRYKRGGVLTEKLTEKTAADVFRTKRNESIDTQIKEIDEKITQLQNNIKSYHNMIGKGTESSPQTYERDIFIDMSEIDRLTNKKYELISKKIKSESEST